MPESTAAVSTSRLPDRLWFPVLLAVALVGCVLAVLLVRTGFDPSKLVRAAPPWTDPAQTLPSLTVVPAEYGFDGQFFYRLAVSPFSSAPTVAGVTFDIPAMRGSRWGYGLVAFAASFGRPDLAPAALLIVNCCALVVISLIGGMFAQSSGRCAGWGVLFALWPGFAYSLTLDTSEILTSAFLLGAMLAARRQSFVLAAIGMSAAVLTRETAMVGAVALLFAGLWSRFGPNRAGTPRASTNGLWIAGAVPIAALAVSQLIQRMLHGQLPLSAAAGNNAGPPFAGVVSAIRESVADLDSGNLVRLVSLLFVLGLIAVGATAFSSSSARLAEKLAWCASVVLFVVLNGNPLVNAPSFMRAGTELGLFTVILLLGSRSRLLVPTAITMAALAAASFGAMVIKMPPG
jgi:hypothetical protein